MPKNFSSAVRERAVKALHLCAVVAIGPRDPVWLQRMANTETRPVTFRATANPAALLTEARRWYWQQPVIRAQMWIAGRTDAEARAAADALVAQLEQGMDRDPRLTTRYASMDDDELMTAIETAHWQTGVESMTAAEREQAITEAVKRIERRRGR